MGRDELKAVFKDTIKQCNENIILRKAIERSILNQKVYKEGAVQFKPNRGYQEPAKIIVSDSTTFKAASKYRGSKTCVLNFASAKRAGGGVENGAVAQEECLCRVSTLYPCLRYDIVYHDFYKQHKKNNFLGNADCIYTPDVFVFKTDDKVPQSLKTIDWFSTDVISCSASNLSHNSINAKQLYDEHVKRAEAVINIALEHNIEVLILGAFGCGVFNNDTRIVATAWRNTISGYRNYFKVIEFAVPKSARNNNYETLKRLIK